jgi:opacity protein-like surface antigen
MKQVVNTVLGAVLVPVCVMALLASSVAHAQDKEVTEKPRADKHYIGLLATTIQHRSIGLATEKAWGQAGTLVVGGHISDLFHAELRAGAGYQDAQVPGSDLSLAIDYYASWYMGLHYPITNYANIYGQFGFSYIQGTADLRNPDDKRNALYQDFEKEFPASSFAVSWIAGMDFEVMDDTYLVFEGGKLFEDTDTKVNSFQFSGGLRYEF